MKDTKVVCPVCGAEFKIAENEYTAVGTVIGKDSGLGTISPELAHPGCTKNKADERLAALRNAGIDTSNLFAMQNASGEGMIVRLKNGVPELVADDDPVFAMLNKKGVIPERRLFRRWITSQMFHMLTYKSWDGRKSGFTEALKLKGFDYQYRMLLDEFKTQAKLAKYDLEAYAERKIFFNNVVASKLILYYATCFKNAALSHMYTSGGETYYYIPQSGTYNDKTLNEMLENIKKIAFDINLETNADEVYNLYNKFMKTYFVRIDRLRNSPNQFREWMDAYKAAGAYYTMKNLIMFHGCKLRVDGKMLSSVDSLSYLNSRIREKYTEGYMLLGMLKEFLAYNNVDIKAKMAEWSKNKRASR
jgi:hypothetical protein